MSYHKSKYDGGICTKPEAGVTDVKVGDVVCFYSDPVETATVNDANGKPVRVKKSYRGVVVFVNQDRRWCTVQYGYNLRTTLYFHQVIPTNFTAVRVVALDSGLPDAIKQRVRDAANVAGAWVTERPFLNGGANHADDIGDECLSDIIHASNGKMQYVQSVSFASTVLSGKYPECMLCNSDDLAAGRVSAETLARLLTYAQPPANLTESPLYIREFVKY